jgi:hypothetical protein
MKTRSALLEPELSGLACYRGWVTLVRNLRQPPSITARLVLLSGWNRRIRIADQADPT